MVTPDQELAVLFGALHLLALAFGGLLFAMFLRSETVEPWRPPDDDDGPGGGGEPPPDDPRTPGGPPLPDAAPARVRLRDHRRLAELLPREPRRREHAPQRTPDRTPAAR